MKRSKFILFLLFCSFSAIGQSVHLCEGNTQHRFSVVPSNSANTFSWDFVNDTTALFIGDTDKLFVFVEFQKSGVYQLRFSETNPQGCVGEVEMDIVVHPIPIPSFSYDALCVDIPIYFENTSTHNSTISTLEWNVNGTLDTNFHQEIIFNNPGLYPLSLYVEDEWGCEGTYSEIAQINSNPTASFYYEPLEPSTLDPFIHFKNFSTPNVQTFWSFGDGNTSNEWEPFHDYDEPKWFDVNLVIKDLNGCKDSVTNSLFIKSDLLFHVPDVFTPNGDIKNDVFGPSGYEMDRWQSYQLKIYTRWGELIFETNDVDTFWEGQTFSGIDAITDTYLWSIRVQSETGKQTHHTGTVTLLK